jgi:glycosyltransferase involved in cell wall biosynthesis
MAAFSATNYNYRSLLSSSKYDFRFFRLINLSAPKEILINAGLFDENLPDISEECPEFGYRLYQQGMKVIYDDNISAKRHDYTTYELLIKNRVHYGRRLYYILKKHPLQSNPALYEFGIDGIDDAGLEKIRDKAARNEVNFNKVTQMFATLSKTMHPEKKVSLNGKIFRYDEMLVRVQDYLKIALEYSIWTGILNESKISAEEFQSGPEPADDEFIFSVIIPTYNRSDILLKCLEALRDQSFDNSKFEVFVCDDGSTDNTAEVVDNFKSNFKLTYLKQENSGPGAARNRGIERAAGKYLLIINDDTIAAKDLLQKHFEAQEKVAGRKAAVMGTFEYTPEARVKPFVYFLSKSPIVFAYPIMEHGKFYNYRFFWTCNISIERSVVLQAGLFDENYTEPMIEDTELGYRLENLGWSVYYDTGCKSWHDHTMDINGFMKRQRMSGRNVVKLIEKHPEILEREKKLFGFEDLSKQTLDEFRAFINEHAEKANKNAEFIAKIDTLEIYNPEFIPVSQTISFKADELVEEIGKLIVDIHFVHFYSGLIEGVEKKASKKDARDLISEIAQKASKQAEPVTEMAGLVQEDTAKSGENKKPKLLFTMFGWNESGGGTMYPRAVAIELAKRGWDVTVFYAGLKHPTVDMPYYTYRSIDSGVNLIGIMNRPVHFTMEKNPDMEIEDKIISRIFSEVLDEINPDIIHFQNFLGLSFEIASIAKSRGVRTIYTPHNYHLPDPRLYMIKSNLESWDSSNFWDNSDLPAQNPGLAAEYETRQKKALKIINEDISLTLAISQRVKEILVDFGADARKIRTAHQIPFLGEGIRADNEVHSPVKFAFLGTVIPHKGVHKIAEAANFISNLNFEVDIYGDGNARYAGEIKQADKHGKLNFRGSYTSADLQRIASETDAVIIPSIWEEGAGLVIPEALSMGLPVICARIGGMPEFIAEGENGFTYPHKSSRNLAAILRRLIENPALLSEMKKNTKTNLKFADFVDYLERIYNSTNLNEASDFLFK